MRKLLLAFLFTVTLSSFLLFTDVQANSKTHIVQSGETLWKIATMYNVSVDSIKQVNNLHTDTIFLNQKLIIQQSSTISPQQYVTVIQNGKKVKVPVPIAQDSNNQDSSKPSVPSAETQKNIVNISLSLQGTPYLWAGTTPNGFDCSGYLYYVFNKAGITLPRLDTLGMYLYATDVTQPVPGDIVFFENTYRVGISHAGIYLGDDQFIHAGSKQVEISSLKYTYWKDKIVGFKRFQ